MIASLLQRVSLKALAGLALAVLAIFIFAWIAEEMLENDTAHFDSYVRTQVHATASPPLTAVMKSATLIGSPIPVIVFTMIAAAIFWHRGRVPRAVVLIVTVAGAGILEFVLKLCFQRTRPVPLFDIPVPKSLSFPSGHALGALCFYGMLARLVTDSSGGRAAHGVIWALAVMMVLIIGFSRIYLGVHYPSDVVAGYTAGVVWLIAMILAEDEIIRWRRARRAGKEL